MANARIEIARRLPLQRLHFAYVCVHTIRLFCALCILKTPHERKFEQMYQWPSFPLLFSMDALRVVGCVCVFACVRACVYVCSHTCMRVCVFVYVYAAPVSPCWGSDQHVKLSCSTRYTPSSSCGRKEWLQTGWMGCKMSYGPEQCFIVRVFFVHVVWNILNVFIMGAPHYTWFTCVHIPTPSTTNFHIYADRSSRIMDVTRWSRSQVLREELRTDSLKDAIRVVYEPSPWTTWHCWYALLPRWVTCGRHIFVGRRSY